MVGHSIKDSVGTAKEKDVPRQLQVGSYRETDKKSTSII